MTKVGTCRFLLCILERWSEMSMNPQAGGGLGLMFMIQGNLLVQNTGYKPLPKGQVCKSRGILWDTLLLLQKMQVKELIKG